MIWVFPKIGGKPPKWMVKIMENPMNKWMIWVVFPLFLETPIWFSHTVPILPIAHWGFQQQQLHSGLQSEVGKSWEYALVLQKSGQAIHQLIPGSSRYLKFLPFNLPKGTNFTHLEDPGIVNIILFTSGFMYTSQVVGNGISEPSTVSYHCGTPRFLHF